MHLRVSHQNSSQKNKKIGISSTEGIEIATAEDYTDEPIPVRVERILSECDFLVGVYVIRYEDMKKDRVVTSQWLMRETFTAHGQGKKFIALVEDGVSDTGGMNIDKELIFFRRDDLVSIQEATVKLLQALRWHGLLGDRNND